MKWPVVFIQLSKYLWKGMDCTECNFILCNFFLSRIDLSGKFWARFSDIEWHWLRLFQSLRHLFPVSHWYSCRSQHFRWLESKLYFEHSQLFIYMRENLTSTASFTIFQHFANCPTSSRIYRQDLYLFFEFFILSVQAWDWWEPG